MKSKVNLHVHTKYSDGKNTVSEVVSILKDAGIEYFSITDHDNIESSFEVAEYAKKNKMKCYNGIEFSCRFLNGEIGFDDLSGCHILGLGIKADEMLKKQKALNVNKNFKMYKLHELLTAHRYNLEPFDENTTRSDIINDLVNKKYATDIKDCKTKILGIQPYLQYANNNIDVQTAIQTIKECGGLAIWAHPFKAPGFGRKEVLNAEQVSKLLDLLYGYGLDGIEAYYHHGSSDYIVEGERSKFPR